MHVKFWDSDIKIADFGTEYLQDFERQRLEVFQQGFPRRAWRDQELLLATEIGPCLVSSFATFTSGSPHEVS